MKRALLMTAIVLGVVAVGPLAHAEDIECRGAVEGGTVDNVIVPPRAVCYLNVVNVKGNVDVGEDATFISACSTLGGNVTADGAADVVLTCSTIGGRVHVVGGGEGFLGDSTVSGNVVFAENDGTVEIESSVILGSLQALRNTGGLSTIASVTISSARTTILARPGVTTRSGERRAVSAAESESGLALEVAQLIPRGHH